MSCFKIAAFKYLANFTRKHLYCWILFLIKVSNFVQKGLQKEVFSCEIWEIFRNTFFHRAPPVAASEIKEAFDLPCFLLWLCTCLFETCGFANNANFIHFKWRLKRKHSPAKCVLHATEIRRMDIRFKTFFCFQKTFLHTCLTGF